MKLAVFDMDGTLANNDDVAIEAAREGLREYWAEAAEVVALPTPEFIRNLVGLPSNEYFGRMLPPDRQGDVERLATRIEDLEAARLAHGEGRCFEGVGEALEAIRGDGWRTALVSNCRRTYFDANLMHVLERRWFDETLCLSDLPTKAANVREVIRRIAGEPGVSIGVMVGDRSTDVDAGRANGLLCIGSLYGFGTAEELTCSDRTLRSIAELPAVLRQLERASP